MLALHTDSKTLYHPSRVDEALRCAAMNVRGVESTVAVFCGERVVGLVRGACDSELVRVRPITHRMWLGFPSYDAMNAAIKGGQFVQPSWRKDPSGWNSQNVWGDYWPVDGVPGPGDYSGPANTARQLSNTTAGAIELRLKTPSGGQTRHLVGRTLANIVAGTVAQLLWLYDRVLTYDGCSITTSLTTLTNTLTAQRYATAGLDGLKILATCSAALGATVANLSSMTVTDNAGTPAVALAPGYTMPWRTSSAAGSTTAPSPVCLPHDNGNGNTIAPFLPLPSIPGVRAVEAFTSSAINTGTVSITLVNPLAFMWQPLSQTVHNIDHARATFQLPRIFDDACLAVLGLSAHGGSAAVGNLGSLRIAHA